MNISGKVYEFRIGGLMNKLTSLSLAKQQSDMRTNASTLGILSCEQYRQFWITWGSNNFQLGQGNLYDNKIIDFDDNSPYYVTGIGLGTSDGNEANWEFEQKDGMF